SRASTAEASAAPPLPTTTTSNTSSHLAGRLITMARSFPSVFASRSPPRIGSDARDSTAPSIRPPRRPPRLVLAQRGERVQTVELSLGTGPLGFRGRARREEKTLGSKALGRRRLATVAALGVALASTPAWAARGATTTVVPGCG